MTTFTVVKMQTLAKKENVDVRGFDDVLEAIAYDADLYDLHPECEFFISTDSDVQMDVKTAIALTSVINHTVATSDFTPQELLMWALAENEKFVTELADAFYSCERLEVLETRCIIMSTFVTSLTGGI